jgi:hypothetical protein
MVGLVERKRLLASVLVICALLAMSGCNKQKKTDEGKTYTPNAKPKQGNQGGGSGESGQSAAKPLNTPADTTNGTASKASDSGTSAATRGQGLAEPGAPVEHHPQPKPAPSPPSPGGHT